MTSQQKPSKTSSSSRRWAQRGAGCLLVLIAIPLIYYGLYFLLREPLPTEPQLIAHRGGPVYAPENTLPAFLNAIKVGADWIEMDVQRTQDGVLVVFHDETVDRTTDGTGNVGDLTLEQIRALDAGNGEQVPTFTEVIALAREAGVGLLPEAKSPHLYPGVANDMLGALEEGDYLHRTAIQSFDPVVLETIQTISPATQVCPLYGLWGLNLGDPRPISADVLCPMAEMVILNPWMIRQAHKDGREVFVWFGVIEHPLTMRFLLALGADGLMVDDPLALAEILDR